MTSRWYSAEVIWQPNAAQNLLWNVITALILMIPCRLPHSCTEHPIQSGNYFGIKKSDWIKTVIGELYGKQYEHNIIRENKCDIIRF